MSKLTLDEAIEHCLEVAKNCEEQAKQCDSDDRYERHVMHKDSKCASEHRQLAEWLMEAKDLREENKFLIGEFDRLIKERVKERAELLKKSEQIAEYKRLLKAAVEDINFYVDCYEAHCDECCCDHDNHCHWKHEAEALALIGGEADGI